jgi:amidase
LSHGDYIEQALQRASDLDAYFCKEGKLDGPLHGIPVSLKDQFDLNWFDSTLGYVGRAYSPRPEDASPLTILHRLNAIIIAKTNISQSIMI